MKQSADEAFYKEWRFNNSNYILLIKGFVWRHFYDTLQIN